MSGSAPIRVVQLTDCHLFADPSAELAGAATGSRLDAVLADIADVVPEFDLLIVTGDTAHDESLEAYHGLLGRLDGWASRLRIVPGNHDDRLLLRTVFPDACADDEGQVRFRETVRRWNLVGLDSHVPGEPAGSLGPKQLTRLAGELAAAPDADTVLFVHHPPVPVGSAQLDAIGLEDAAALSSLVEAHEQVRLIVCGHVHQEATGRLGSASVLTTPAVAPQFRPDTPTIVVEQGSPPGYRVLELSPGGTWSSKVRRVPVRTA